MVGVSETVVQVSRSSHSSLVRRFSPAIPYIAVALGLYIIHNAFASIALYHLGVIAVLVAEGRFTALRRLTNGFHPWLLCGAIVLCLAGGGFTYFCWPLVGLSHFAERLSAVGLSMGILPWFFLYFSLVNPMLEEAFWREYHGNASSRPTWHDLWFAGYHLPVLALFMHWYWLPLILFGLVTIAWIWRQLVHHFDGLLINTASHIAADVGVVVAVLVILSEP